MEEPKNKYILLNNRVGYTIERNLLSLGLSTKSIPTNVLRGELLEALPEAEQPQDLTRIALVGIDRKSLRIECSMEDLTRLMDEDANLLLAICCSETRYQLLIGRKSLDFGRRLLPNSQVFVSVKGITKDVVGVVWYKGELPSLPGTMFGIELIKNPGQGTCNGRFRNKQYFECEPDSGVFVGLDKLKPKEDLDPPAVMSVPFLKGKTDHKSAKERCDKALEINQRVVTFLGDRGTVRYIGEEKDASGNVQTIVGLEMDERNGSGTGKRNGRRLFLCKRDFAAFVALETVIPEKDFDENPAETTGEKTSERQDSFQGQIQKEESLTRSMSYDYGTSGIESSQMTADIPHGLEMGSMVEVPMAEGFPRYGVIRWIGNLPQVKKDKLVAGLELEDEQSACSDGTFNGDRYFTCPKGRGYFALLMHCRQDSRFIPNTPTGDTSFHSEKANQPSETSRLNLQRQGMEEQLTNVQGQLREKELQEVNFHEQLKDKDQQLENAQRQLREKEQQLTNFQGQLREKELQEANLHEQLREKDQQQENSQRHLREVEQQLREKGEQEENLQRQLREMEQQLTNFQGQLRGKELQEANLHEQLREKEQQQENAQRQLREKNQQQENAQRQLREMEQQLTNLQGQFRGKEEETTTLEGQLRAKDEEVNELEITLSTARQALNNQQRQQSPDWVIPGDQIQLTDKCLGRGGWGCVVEGKYCGCAVAVKQIHELILSPHNRSLFEREMDIASRCRHPCLLQFIGATNDEGSPLFVTELMETSLRALLELRPLSAAEVSIISLDVARALNYLHQKKPSPIIHRDVSSANVLLWRQGDQWRGKVSDYGTANFMQHTMTVAPGAPLYLAPEAVNPRSQTVKIDVYSFGVLLSEMCIRELPDPERRDQQVVMVTNRLLRALIRGCLQSEPETRPNMEEIVEELQEPA